MTPGHAAYVKWRETVFAQVTGNTELMDQVRHQLVVRIAPEWVDCIPTVTDAWEGIAQAAIDAIPTGTLLRERKSHGYGEENK